ncbi:uncharacterized protein LOC105021206 [Esox lucius]|uniref:uncharacterized protein LOC105021206 n=1 Tax=Esox lucius TaxID=8010 RepID=UPI0014776BE4|nr:uncharacterized protein LOC105021206 [Esox lucius]XP_028972492.2 uncharacterized protein LOC105021206 [Esox lucius]
MEGETEDQKEDSEAFSPHAFVLWEKCIQQSIFVDLSEDESLHFSDLEGSFTVQLSQADSAASENSIHLSGNVELSLSDQGDSTGKSSCVSSQSERVVEGDLKTRGSVMHVSAQRPNTEQEQTILDGENPADTSDEDQEDLPYDGELGSQYINPKTKDSRNSVEHSQRSLYDCSDFPAMVKQVNIIKDPVQIAINTMSPACLTPKGESKVALIDSTKAAESISTHRSTVGQAPYPDITQLLLRHFSQDELLCSGRLIEAETLPEVSLLDSSVDESVRSRAPWCSRTCSPNRDIGASPQHSSTEGPSSKSGSQNLQDKDEERSVFRNPMRNLKDKNTGRKSPTASEENDRGCADESYNSDINYPENSDRSNSKSSSGSDLTNEKDQIDEEDEEDQLQIVPLIRTRSFSELKYGQGQVHFPLPDFSKVAPRVKVPKNNYGSVKPVSQSPAFLRAKSSPSMLGRSSALEVINRAMEDSIQPDRTYAFRDQDKQTKPSSGLVHHLQAEYDKLLTKYAEAENLIDQMRLGTKTKAPSDFKQEFDIGDQPETLCPGGSHFVSRLFSKTPSGQFTDEPNQQNHSKLPDNSTHSGLHYLTEGERMTCEFRDIISQFMQKVVEFKTCFTTNLITIEEQQMVFKSIMGAQDQLERRYISKKEEHRALEMQNYMGLARNMGQFDPERQVEGEIFRIGMQLEDIKDLIDRNVCEQKLSPPHSPLTLQPLCEEVSPGPPGPSPPPALPLKVLTLQDPGPCVSTGGYETDEEDATEVRGNDGLDVSGDVTPAESPLTSTGHSSVSLRLSQSSFERLDITNIDEDEEENTSFLSEGVAQKRGQEYFARQNSPDRLWTPESPDLECLAVEVSSSDVNTQSIKDQTPNSSQSIVSPETDSGFGSSDLSRPATGLSQPKRDTERFRLQSDGNSSPMSLSNSEGSCSNLQTTMHQPQHTGQRRPSLQIPVHLNGDIGDQRPSLKTPVHLNGDIGDQRPSLKTPVHLNGDIADQGPSLQTPVHLNGDIGDQRPSLQSPVHLTGDIGDQRPSLLTPVHQTGDIGDQRPAQLQFSGTAVDYWLTSTQLIPAEPTDSPSEHSPDRLLNPPHSVNMDTIKRDRPSHSVNMDTIQRDRPSHSVNMDTIQRDRPSHSVNMDTIQRDRPSHSCSCHSEAIQALQSEVSQLKRDLEEGLVQLPHLSQRIDQLTYRCRRPKPRSRTSHLNIAGSRQSLTHTRSKILDLISSDIDFSSSKDADSMKSDRSGIPLPFHSTPQGGRRGGSKPYSCFDRPWKPQGKTHFNTASEEICVMETSYSSPPALRLSHKNSRLRFPSATGDWDNVYSKGRHPLSILDKPLLQVNYGSSCSLPAGFKAREQQSVSHHRRRSTQSDSALLPSNVYFQRILPLAVSPLRAGGRAGRHRANQDEDINRTLDRAIEAARCMKRTTDRMAKSLSADLAKAALSRKLCALHPLTGS